MDKWLQQHIDKFDENNNVIKVAERIYHETNPESKMDVPSMAYETVKKLDLQRMKEKSKLSLYDYCKEKLK